MKIKVLIGILVFLIVLNLATMGTWVYYQFLRPAQPAGRAVPAQGLLHRPGQPPPMVNLEPDQRRKFRQLLREMHQSKRPIQHQLRQLHYRLRLALSDTTVSADSLRVLLDSLAMVQRQLNDMTIDYFLQARKFLTPQQREQLFRFMLLPGGRQRHF